MTMQDEEAPIDREIVDELVAIVPTNWNRATLEVTYSLDERGEGFDHVIYSPEGHRDLVEPSDEIYSATWRLQQLFKKYGGSWRSAKYDITIEGENVRYKVKFDLAKTK